MKRAIPLVKAVNFKEQPLFEQQPNATEAQYELTKDNNQTHKTLPVKQSAKAYCKHLLFNLKEVEAEDLEDYINNLASQTIFPIHWLNQLEKLINLNLLLLEEKASPLFLSTFHLYLEEKRTELEERLEYPDGLNIRRSNGSYSFKKVKAHLAKIEGFCEQKLFLNRCKIEYLQFKPRYIAVGSTPFDERIDLEIERITQEELFQQAKQEHLRKSSVPGIQKIKANCQINQLADIFFQMIHEVQVEGKALLETSNANAAKLLSNFFIDAQGNTIEQSTIETYLQLSKPEKRPKEYNRIRLT